MTGPPVRLTSDDLRVEPGGQVQTTLTIGNTGDIVEGFRLEVLGDEVAGFASMTPDEVQVFPGAEATAVLVFSPPEGSASTGGRLPFGVRVSSVVDPQAVTVVEGDLEVGRVFGLTPKTVPVTSSGRWRGRHLLTLTNWGNSAVTLKISATDPDEKLAFLVLPNHLQLPVGSSGSAQIRVRTRAPFLRGSAVRHPFRIVAEPDPPDPRPTTALTLLVDDRRAAVDAAFLQKPVLSRAVVMAATVLVLALGGGIAYALTRPAPEPRAVLAGGMPERPALAATAAEQTITLRWSPQPGVEGYDLYEMIDGARGPHTALPGAQGAHVIAGVSPDSTRCYTLQARRGTTVSPLSQPACATVPPPAITSPVLDSAAAPTDPTAAPSTDDIPTTEQSVTSDPPAQPDQPSQPTVPGSVGTTTATEPPAASTDASPGAGSTTAAADGIGPGAHIAVLAVFPAGDTDPLTRAEARRDTLAAALPDVTVAVLDTADYPSMLLGNAPVRNDGFVVYVGPFASAGELTAWCADLPSDVGASCIDARPVPG